MKKVVACLFISFCLFIGFSSRANAQDISVCLAMGFEDGCVRCGYNPDTLPNPTCQMEDTSAIDNVGCRAGADTPDPSVCNVDVSTDDGINACNALYVACVPRVVEDGGYFCQIDGISRSCNKCDNNPETVNPECPTNTGVIYDDEDDCISSCIIPSDNYDCVTSGGVCQASCDPDQDVKQGATCEPGKGLDVCCNTPVSSYICRKNTPQTGIDTAIGCIPFAQPESIAAFFIKWGLRIGGGIAVLIFLAAGFQFITSSGDPEKIKSAKDLFLAAITGLLMIIFCVFLLRVIGFNILQIFQP